MTVILCWLNVRWKEVGVKVDQNRDVPWALRLLIQITPTCLQLTSLVRVYTSLASLYTLHTCCISTALQAKKKFG
jgi:hypothetical protein